MGGKYAIITGAASGMGRCYALQLAGLGYGLLLIDINGDALSLLSQQLVRQHQVPVHVMCIDLTHPDAAEQIVDRCNEENLSVEILINNAGILVTGSIEDAEPDRLRHIVALHCTTPLLLCQKLIPVMKQQGSGYILNISSVTAWMDWPVIGIYGCTKRFVKNYSRILRIECMGTPVSVTTAVFGAVDTPLVSNLLLMRFRKVLLRLGIMLSPEKATRRALKAMFKRKATFIPTLLDRLVILLSPLLPNFLLSYLSKKIRI